MTSRIFDSCVEFVNGDDDKSKARTNTSRRGIVFFVLVTFSGAIAIKHKGENPALCGDMRIGRMPYGFRRRKRVFLHGVEPLRGYPWDRGQDRMFLDDLMKKQNQQAVLDNNPMVAMQNIGNTIGSGNDPAPKAELVVNSTVVKRAELVVHSGTVNRPGHLRRRATTPLLARRERGAQSADPQPPEARRFGNPATVAIFQTWILAWRGKLGKSRRRGRRGQKHVQCYSPGARRISFRGARCVRRL